MKIPYRSPLAILATAAILAACGGDGGSSKPTQVSAPPSTTNPPLVLAPSASLANMCAAPRSGMDREGQPFADRQGTLANEKSFLRSWIDEEYLWYREVPANLNPASYPTAIDYFNVLKSPLFTASGKPKDEFHFTYDSAEWERLQSSGVSLGYGITWSRLANTAPRTWYASMVEPGSPAAVAGVRRGDRLVLVDNVDFTNANGSDSVNRINAGLFPERAGERHTFTLARSDGTQYTIAVTAADVAATPVQNTMVIDTPTGKVGYLTFNSHNAVAERQLIDAFNH
ncbi:MAG TPA: peptidase S41, partial [Ramlibacter sp.]|nr:peptidase S41 [Ramlibacter sp.]